MRKNHTKIIISVWPLLCESIKQNPGSFNKKMHEPGCPYVRDLAESQYIRYNNREKALAAGYKSCKHCDP